MWRRGMGPNSSVERERPLSVQAQQQPFNASHAALQDPYIVQLAIGGLIAGLMFGLGGGCCLNSIDP